MGERLKQRPKARHKVDNEKGSKSDEPTRNGCEPWQSMAAQRRQIWAHLSPEEREEEELHNPSLWPAALLLMKRWMRPQSGRLAGQLKPQCLLYIPQAAPLSTCCLSCAGTVPRFPSCLTESRIFCIYVHTRCHCHSRAKSVFVLSSLYVITCDILHIWVCLWV